MAKVEQDFGGGCKYYEVHDLLGGEESRITRGICNRAGIPVYYTFSNFTPWDVLMNSDALEKLSELVKKDMTCFEE